ncbi:hypothetical protein H8959_013080 [Pygathrix nigripes]
MQELSHAWSCLICRNGSWMTQTEKKARNQDFPMSAHKTGYGKDLRDRCATPVEV